MSGEQDFFQGSQRILPQKRQLNIDQWYGVHRDQPPLKQSSPEYSFLIEDTEDNYTHTMTSVEGRLCSF